MSEVVDIPMVFNSPLKRYQYSFDNYDPNKEYLCDIDCWLSSIIRYLSCALWDKNEWERIWNYNDKPLILNLNDRMAKIL